MKENKNRPEGCTAGLFIGSFLRIVTTISSFLFKIIFKLLIFFGLWVPVVYALFGFIIYKTTGFNPFDFSLYSTIYLSGLLACVVCCVIISIKNAVINPAKSIYAGYKYPLWSKNKKAAKPEPETEEKELKNRWEIYAEQKRAKRLSPPEIDAYTPTENSATVRPEYLIEQSEYLPPQPRKSDELLFDWLPKNQIARVQPPPQAPVRPHVASAPRAETPIVYFSKLEDGLLVYEYADRFELYKITSDGKRKPVKTEYK